MSQSLVAEKSFAFAVRVVRLYQHLSADKKEFVLSRQLLRSGTSIGANVAESLQAQSRPDFVAKLSIALKESNETRYWLRLLHATDYLSDRELTSILADREELIKLLTSIIKSSKSRP